MSRQSIKLAEEILGHVAYQRSCQLDGSEPTEGTLTFASLRLEKLAKEFLALSKSKS
jgi:hypothetical protein